MQLRTQILDQISLSRKRIIHIVANVSGQTETHAELRTISIAGYVIVLICLLSIHKKLIKKQTIYKQKIVELYDTIRYQVAKTQYATPSIQATPGIKTIMDAEHKTYEANTQAIQQEIKTMEQLAGSTIITEDQRVTIEKQISRKRRFSIIVNIFGRCITIITAGVYKLFW
ncbi:MAG: hypothetical protein WCH65_04600 [bacterium]